MEDKPTDDVAGTLEHVERLSEGSLSHLMGIRFVEASPRRLVATMPVKGNLQPFGLLHGGASCVLIETLGSIGATLHAGTLGRLAVGIEISATHHRAARSGLVTGVAEPLHLGGTLATYSVVITDDLGHRVCTGRITCLLRERPPAAG